MYLFLLLICMLVQVNSELLLDWHKMPYYDTRYCLPEWIWTTDIVKTSL